MKDDDTSFASDGISAAEFTGYLDTGCYIFNAVLSGSIYGGVPNNKITALAGEHSTGKTFLVLGVVKNFLDVNKNGIVVYFDTEAAVTKEMLIERGIDTKRVIKSEQVTIEGFRTKAVNILDSYMQMPEEDRYPLLMVLDSLGQLSSIKEINDMSKGEDKRDMTKAQLIKGAFRVLTLKCARAKVPFLVTNHIYAVPGAYIPTKEMSGGSGLKYVASTIVFLSKKKERDKDNNIVGNIIKIKMEKNRLSKENSVVEAKLSYDKGLDLYYGLLDLAQKQNLVKKVSNKYEFPDGSKAFEKNIYDEPEKYFTADLLKQLDEAAKREFSYGQDNEQSFVHDQVEQERDKVA